MSAETRQALKALNHVEHISASEWFDWLTEKTNLFRRSYLEMPERLISDYRQERETMHGYAGREILELLQNASDAAMAAGTIAQVRIELGAGGLLIGNTGAVFSREGVGSLLLAHMSPKRQRRQEFIGNKGLGFRALLNWSHCPVIASGELRLAFSPAHAADNLGLLMTGSARLKAIVETEAGIGDESPLPLLAFPHFARAGAMPTQLVGNPAQLQVLLQCEKLLSDGMDTAIGIPLDDAEIHKQAELQLMELRPELLLFVPGIERIEIQIAGTAARMWWREAVEGGRHRLHREEGESQSVDVWRVFQDFGQIEAVASQGEKKRTLDYALAVAVPESGAIAPGRLFSYFPTDVPFPLPVAAHATLELEQNRKQPQARPANDEVLRHLAVLLAKCAETWQQEHPDHRGAGLALAARTGDWPPALVAARFGETLIGELRNRAVVPRLDGRHVVAAEATRLRPGASTWLPLPEFSDVLRDDGEAAEQSLLSAMVEREMKVGEFLQRIRAAQGLSIDARARVIVGITKHLTKECHSPELLVDINKLPVPADCRTFLTAGTPSGVQLPAWAKIRFLNAELRDAMMNEFAVTEQRELQKLLDHFQVREWSLATICEALVADANCCVEKDGSIEGALTEELLRTLAQLFHTALAQKQRPMFPEKAVLKLPTQRKGVWTNSRTLCLGAGLGERGELLQALYGTWAPERIVALPDTVMPTETAATQTDFLRWLGVLDLPPLANVTPPEAEYLDHVRNSLRYPVNFGDRYADSVSDLAVTTLTNVVTVVGIEGILKHAEPATILAWLSIDSRAATWKLPMSDYGILRWMPFSAQKFRYYQGAIPSYVRWKLQHTAWLPTEQGTKEMPGKCLAGVNALADLMPTPFKPDTSMWRTFGVPEESLRDAWDRAGVMLGLAYAPWRDIYQLLRELPTRDPAGKVARSLYRYVLEHTDTFIGDPEVEGKTFRAEGQMWGTSGAHERYWPVTQLRHLDVGDLPGPLAARLKLVAMERRRGARKIQRLFGIQPIDTGNTRVRVLDFKPHPQADAVQTQLTSAKPWLWTLHEANGGSQADRDKLTNLRIVLSSRVFAHVGYESEQQEYELADGDVLRDGLTVYVRTDQAASLASVRLARAIGDEIASIFGSSHGNDFSWLLREADEDRDELLRELAPAVELGKTEVWPSPPPAPRALVYHPAPLVTASKDSPKAETDGQTPTAVVPKRESGPLVIEHLPHTPKPPATRTPMVIQQVSPGGGGGAVSTGRKVTDWSFCENKAVEFEEHDEPRRYPVRVGHMTGHEAPGCDILSFATSEARDSFIKEHRIDDAAVARLIEVKARADEHARIMLAGNELEAARRHADRYFIYRFYEDSDGSFLVTMVQNPLSQAGAYTVYEIDLERSEGQKRRLRGGLSSQAAST